MPWTAHCTDSNGQALLISFESEHWTMTIFARLFKVTRLPLLLAQLLGDSFPEDAVQTVLSLSSGEAAAPVPAKVTRFGSRQKRTDCSIPRMRGKFAKYGKMALRKVLVPRPQTA